MQMYKSIVFFAACFMAQPVLPQSTSTDLSNEISQHESSETPPLIERALFLKESKIVDAKLSPDGKYVAYSIHERLGQAIYLLDTGTLEKSRRFDSFNLIDFIWADDSSLVYLELSNAIAYLPVSESASPAFIVAADYKNKGIFLGPDHSNANGIFVMFTNADDEFLLEHYSLNGDHETILRSNNGERITQARLTPNGDTLFVRIETAAGFQFYIDSDNEHQQFYSCGLVSNPYSCQMISYDEQSNTLWLTGNMDSDLIRMLAYSLTDATLSTVHGDPDNITDLSAWTLQQNVPAIVQYENGLASNYGFKTSTQTHLDHLSSLFPDTNFIATIGDNNVWLLEESGAILRDSRFYLYQPDTRQINLILEEESSTIESLSSVLLSQKIPVSYNASDGMLIHAYVSLPKGVDLSQAPFIAMPHPGPNGRVVSDYYAETQFLVNRGYIVFEPNFRLSTGYGIDYVMKANREVGNSLMQQDIIDGIDYLLEQDIGHADKLGITGFSFGGYSVLTGLAYTPELFKAGVSLAGGAADFGAIVDYQVNRSNMRKLRPIGYSLSSLTIVDVDDPEDRERLYQLSPRASIDTFDAPLLLLVGGNDPTAPIELTKDFVLAMVNQNKDITYFFDEDLGHGNWPEYEASAYFAMMEEFFSRYLGGRQQAIEESAIEEYIQKNILVNSSNTFSVLEN